MPNLVIIPCVLCSRFHRQADAPPAHGYCEGWEKFRRHDDTNAACVLFKPARDEARRRDWAATQVRQETAA